MYPFALRDNHGRYIHAFSTRAEAEDRIEYMLKNPDYALHGEAPYTISYEEDKDTY